MEGEALHGGEGGNSKSRLGATHALPLRGQPPRASASLRSPREGGIPPSEPPFESHRQSIEVFQQVWRRGWDSNPRSLSGQRFSRPSDSAALAPLRARSGKDVQLTVDGFEIQMNSYA